MMSRRGMFSSSLNLMCKWLYLLFQVTTTKKTHVNTKVWRMMLRALCLSAHSIHYWVKLTFRLLPAFKASDVISCVLPVEVTDLKPELFIRKQRSLTNSFNICLMLINFFYFSWEMLVPRIRNGFYQKEFSKIKRETNICNNIHFF